MAIFIGKIDDHRKKSPKKLSNTLPINIIYLNKKYYKISNGKKVLIHLKKENFYEFFNLNYKGNS